MHKTLYKCVYFGTHNRFSCGIILFKKNNCTVLQTLFISHFQGECEGLNFSTNLVAQTTHSEKVWQNIENHIRGLYGINGVSEILIITGVLRKDRDALVSEINTGSFPK